MLKALFGSLSRERTLVFIAAREEGYAREITEFWGCPDRPIKRELNRLEAEGILTAKSYGRTVSYSMNPRFYLRRELKALLLKAIDAYPPEWMEKLLYNRRRPRAKGKPVNWLEKPDKKRGKA
jgi:hypothetical protein